MKHLSAETFMELFFADIGNALLSSVLAPTSELSRINILSISGIFQFSLSLVV